MLLLGFLFNTDYSSDGRVIDEPGDPAAPFYLTLISFVLYEIIYWLSVWIYSLIQKMF
jgi:hypothetical protein